MKKESNIKLLQRYYPKFYEELIHEYADKFELSQHLNKYPFELSGGQKQRTSIVQQLLVGNKIILLDEPFSGLDCHMIDKVKNSLLKVSLENSLNTLIIVSHDLENSISISDRAIILSNKNNTAASIVQDFNLIDMGIAYQDNVKYLSQFQDLIKTIKENL
jgi:ABC-type nitrate/sulfonate/bicarbonate transport system ATPase subunit